MNDTCEDCMWFDLDEEVCHNRESPHLLEEVEEDHTCEAFNGGEDEVKEVFYLIEMPMSQGKSWVKFVWENDDKFYQNPQGGKFLARVDITVIEKVEGGSFDDLDWTKTYLNISENGAGWLDPKARFHGCPFQQHERYAHLILKKDSVEMEKQRWVRVTNTEKYVAWHSLSPEQRMWLDRKGYEIEDYGYL